MTFYAKKERRDSWPGVAHAKWPTFQTHRRTDGQTDITVSIHMDVSTCCRVWAVAVEFSLYVTVCPPASLRADPSPVTNQWLTDMQCLQYTDWLQTTANWVTYKFVGQFSPFTSIYNRRYRQSLQSARFYGELVSFLSQADNCS